MEYSRDELLWAAGFWDGEGCSSVHRSKQPNGKVYKSVLLSVAQLEPEPLDRFHAALGGMGRIYGPYEQERLSSGRKPVRRWKVTKIVDAAIFFNLIGPFLCAPKAEQFRRVWDECVAERKDRHIASPSL